MADEATLVNDAAGAVAGNDGAEEDEYAQTYTELSALQAAGVAAADLTKLAEGGYHTANALLMTPSKDLEAVKGLSEAKIQKIREAAQQVIPAWQVRASSRNAHGSAKANRACPPHPNPAHVSPHTPSLQRSAVRLESVQSRKRSHPPARGPNRAHLDGLDAIRRDPRGRH